MFCGCECAAGEFFGVCVMRPSCLFALPFPRLFFARLYIKRQRNKERKRDEPKKDANEGPFWVSCSPLCCCLTSPEVKSRKKQTNQEAFFFLFSARLSVYLPLSFSLSLLLSPALLLCCSHLTSNNRHRRGRKGRGLSLDLRLSLSRFISLSPLPHLPVSPPLLSLYLPQ